MSDLRSQINSLSAAEKAELLDTLWESLEADSASLTEAQRAELDYRIALHVSFRGSKSGRASSRSRDTPGRLDPRGE
jgi:putative addiction module component (TIGR02574 family)